MKPRAQLIREARALDHLKIKLARDDVNFFCEYVMKDESTGEPIKQAPIHEAWHDLAEKHNRLIVWSHIESGKCLGRGTPVLMADGEIRAVEDVRVGDRIASPTGPRNVLSLARGRDIMYRIIPKKGEPWECNSEHVLTLVETWTDRVHDTPIREYLNQNKTWKAKQKLFRAPVKVFVGAKESVIDPYFLGVWFGDGHKRVVPGRNGDQLWQVRITKYDREIAECVQSVAEKWGLRFVDRAPNYFIRNPGVGKGRPNVFLNTMRDLIGPNVEIPQSMMIAPWEQRSAFLAGFIDTDGSVNGSGIVITQKRLDYANALQFIARSLGLYASVRERTVKGYGIYYDVGIYGDFGHIPIRIARKIPRPRRGGAGRRAKDPLRTGFCVECIGEGDYYGFTLDGDGRFLLGDFTVTHNTVQLAVARTLWKTGRDPNRRGLILSNTKDQARKVANTVKRYIESSEELHRVFPHLKPGRPWGEYAFSVERGIVAKDPTIQTSGVHGNIQGSRLDDVICDDILDFENTRTEHQRKQLIDWVRNAPLSRLVEGGTFTIIGVAYHHSDLLHMLAKSKAWFAVKYPVVHPETGKPRWPERWSPERIAAKHEELGSIEFHRQLLCEPHDDHTARFKRPWIEKCKLLGEGRSITDALKVVPSGYKVYTGVDLAVQQKDSADQTCFFTIAVEPNGLRHVINIETGRWSGPEIVKRIISVHHRYQSIVMIENVAAQDFILQFARHVSAVPVVPFTTGRNKAHPEFGIESLATEMEAGRWAIPNTNGNCHPEVQAWIDEMLYYDPSAHTGDRLIASWLAREAIKRGQRKVQTANVDFLRR